MKFCYKCVKGKARTCFYKNSSKYDGLASECILCMKEIGKIRAIKKKKEIAKYKQTWNIQNKKHMSNYNKNYLKENKAKILARNRARELAKLQRTPPWLTKAQHEEMADIYKQAKELEAIFFNRKFHVDHIVPLQGKDVCGLHVPWNLQILTAEENLAKSNK